MTEALKLIGLTKWRKGLNTLSTCTHTHPHGQNDLTQTSHSDFFHIPKMSKITNSFQKGKPKTKQHNNKYQNRKYKVNKS